MRKKSKEAYDKYCKNRKYRENDLGIPIKESILGYWESCLRRNVIPSKNDMVQCGIASPEEAEVMLPYLMERWMTVPEFSQWINGIISRSKLESISEKLRNLPKMIEAVEKIEEKLEMQSINGIATIMTPAYINDAKYSCTDSKIKDYYMVNNRFDIMLSVISAGKDIPSPQAEQKIAEFLEAGSPVIITGNGGQGKTSLMLKAAVKWVENGKPAIWLALSSSEEITERQARDFYNSLIQLVPTGEKLLVCIDNPYEGRRSFENLSMAWGDCDKIQLLMAERENRLSMLADPDSNLLLNWFKNSELIVLQGVNQDRKYTLHGYPVGYSYFKEEAGHRKKIINKSTYFLVKEKAVSEEDRNLIIKKILDIYERQNVSIVELIYRTLFEMNKIISKDKRIKLDWDEWGDLLKKEFNCDWSYIDLYGVIAAFKIFNVPFTLSLFCKYFDFDEKKLRSKLRESFLQSHVEPVIFKKNKEDKEELQTKHDVIAELFFSFNKRKVSIDDLILNLIDVMDKEETEIFLKCIVENNKKEIKKGYKHLVGNIDYWSYMKKIYLRSENGSFNLLCRSKAYLCLGAIWAKKQKSEDEALLKDMLESIAPPVESDILLAKLYTEWGIWAASKNNKKLAEKKFLEVINNIPGQIPARTELGRLLSKQGGREAEAEKYLKEAIEIDPKNLPPKNVLAELYEKLGRLSEAKKLYQEICDIDPENKYGLGGLSRLK